MTTATDYHRRVAAYLRDEYGVADVEMLPAAGDHFRLRFTYAGREHALTLHGSRAKLGGNALAMKRQDIRHLLGPPPPRAEARARRRLEDMMPTLEARSLEPLSSYPRPEPVTGAGTVALYRNGGAYPPALRFTLPPEAADRFGTADPVTVGGRPGEWVVEHAAAGRSQIKHGANGWYLNRTDPALSGGVAPFGAVPAEVEATAERLTIRTAWPPAAARVRKTRARPTSDTNIHHAAGALEVAPVQPAVDEAFIRDTLAAVRRVEAATPYRLVRLRDGAGIAFQAPRIE